MFAITTICCNNRQTLFDVLDSFVIRTRAPETKWIILLQGCNNEFVAKIQERARLITNSQSLITFDFIVLKDNIGLSKGANLLAEKSRSYRYVLHVEDDWLCLPTAITGSNYMWLTTCLEFLESHHKVSTLFLRKYSSDQEKHQYAWNRTANYQCHSRTGHFNYAAKMKDTHIEVYKDIKFQEIPHFLFTFNPCIRRNEDYHRVGVFPLNVYDDAIKKERENQWTQTQYGDAPNWGWCEAFAMEKTYDLITYNVAAGIFGHHEDWIAKLKAADYAY